MALQVQKLTRVFVITKNGKKMELDDPNPNMAAIDVAKFYAGDHPELTNCVVEGPKAEGDKAVYTLSTKAGRLG